MSTLYRILGCRIQEHSLATLTIDINPLLNIVHQITNIIVVNGDHCVLLETQPLTHFDLFGVPVLEKNAVSILCALKGRR
jgi:hypothetical protein